MAAKRLAAMFEQKEQESRAANAKQKMPISSASKPLNSRTFTANATYKQHMVQQQNKQDQEQKSFPQPLSAKSVNSTVPSTSINSTFTPKQHNLPTAQELNKSSVDPKSITQVTQPSTDDIKSNIPDSKSSPKPKVPSIHNAQSKSASSSVNPNPIKSKTSMLEKKSKSVSPQPKSAHIRNTSTPSTPTTLNSTKEHQKTRSQPLDDRKQREIDKMAQLKDARKIKTSALLNDTTKRRKIKELKNLSGGGFKIRVNHRYILDDGRIGVCRFKGRTAFGKSSEDWIGIVVEFGTGRHNGTVQGKTYFRCREGQGAMVQTERILIDMGNRDKCPIDDAMKRKAKSLSEEYAILQEEKKKKKKRKKGWKTDDEFGGWSPPKWDDFEEDHSEMFGKKLLYPKTLLDKNKGKKAEKKKHHTEV